MDYLKMRVQQLAKLRLQNLFIIFPVGRDYYGFPAELRQMLRPQASPMYGCQVTGRKVPSDNCESLQPECPYKSESPYYRISHLSPVAYILPTSAAEKLYRSARMIHAK